MPDYYSQKLSAQRLQRVYDIAPPRVRQYLDAEIDFVLQRIKLHDAVLELGCGYGRLLTRLREKAEYVIGIDTSLASLTMGATRLKDKHLSLACMDASQLAFARHTFDAVICLQNGISAFHVDQKHLIRESVRVTAPGGLAIFSSYSEAFWDDRLEWFRLQAEHGLLGEIDCNLTRDGTIVCKDGFKATTVSEKDFIDLTIDLGREVEIKEVDRSSLFCLIHV